MRNAKPTFKVYIGQKFSWSVEQMEKPYLVP